MVNNNSILKQTFLILFSSFVFLIMSCDDSNKQKVGFQTFTNLCFTVQGGDTSDQIYAPEEWSITISDDIDEWLTIKPLSGNGSSSKINVILNAKVNNNPESRSGTIHLNIGNKKDTYLVFQDGTLMNECNN